jgi:hypothetical protein
MTTLKDVLASIDTTTEDHSSIPDYGGLEWVQLGLDALAELPADVRAQLAWGEQYLRRRKAVLEAAIPFSDWPIEGIGA